MNDSNVKVVVVVVDAGRTEEILWLIDRPETDWRSGISGISGMRRFGLLLRRQSCFSAAVSVKASRALRGLSVC